MTTIAPQGMLLINKPSGITSHDAVQVIRRKLSIRRVGHTGTLDPMAEGLLILLVGEATRHQQLFQAHDKSYEATLRLGLKTATGDAEGRLLQEAAVPAFSREQLEETLSSLQGRMEQTPPAFSAVKVRGRPAYWWARHNTPVLLAARRVHIFSLSLLSHTVDTLTIAVACSAGTYVRTLAEVIAEKLGTVGHVTRLTRTRVGQWSVDEADDLSWCEKASNEALLLRLRPVTGEKPCLQPAS